MSSDMEGKMQARYDAYADMERQNLAMPASEFTARFTAELLRIVGPTYWQDDDGGKGEGGEGSTAEYAAMVAPTYYDDAEQRVEGPEACASTDYAYWSEP